MKIQEEPIVIQRSSTFTSKSAQFFNCENLYPTLRDLEISEELTEFYEIRKHFLIFTEAGKPVYTRYGDE